ncbi:EscU/YscU/HrcU family type III secretion system export apparatus switch protein [Cellulosilyticum ruminicola]|uniref:EscU/YscU/HrcU family type III secretion system export apparatus switch protein n=1 Tax=Cellulosilyticum ruminicola TaxID=425254 RepID=UPI000ABC88D5|nr:EscU/YscU/HrcU family type III secretion system export apparatus switch protein [Cellulosilyticum ruminicola]
MGHFLVLAVLDYAYQRYKHEESIKMTKQEVKEEYKNAEGDPQIKGKIRQKMREGSMRRMMQAVPDADVIITNPTHFAIAIKYDPDKGRAPVVVAKGVDYVAQKIKEKAKECNIQIVENKPLARSLYYTVDLDREIPPELYGAVAEVLAFVYNLENKHKK